MKTIIEALKHKNSEVRKKAAIALAEMGEKALPAVPVLTDVLKDENHHVRMAAIAALGEILKNLEPAFTALRQALKDQAWQVQVTASLSLVQIGCLDFQKPYAKDASEKSKNGMFCCTLCE